MLTSVTALVSAAALVATLAGAGAAGQATVSAGSAGPGPGALVYQEQQCWTCHVFEKAGSAGKAGPDLDRWLRPHAAQLRIPLDRFVAGRVQWGGRGMPAYATSLSVTQLEDLVTFITGKPYSVPAGGVTPVPAALAPPPVVVASGATIGRWLKVKHLNGTAARGASLFGKEGCLSCHRYLGSGVKRFGAQDLTDGGVMRRNALGYQRYVARPDRYGNRLMPAYADLGSSNLRAIGEFITASKKKLR